MPTSKRKLQANRSDAKRTGASQPLWATNMASTGPRTTTGRETVSQNRTTHGLCGRFRVLPSENQAEYDDLFERFFQSENPVDDVDRELVAKMARHSWLSERAIRFQEACFLFQPQTPEQQVPDGAGRVRQSFGVLKDIHVYLRYQAHHDRAYERAASELAKRRNDRRLAERGFESQKRAEAEETRREQQQNQRCELHRYKVATAVWHLERQRERAAKANSSHQPPKTATLARSAAAIHERLPQIDAAGVQN